MLEKKLTEKFKKLLSKYCLRSIVINAAVRIPNAQNIMLMTDSEIAAGGH